MLGKRVLALALAWLLCLAVLVATLAWLSLVRGDSLAAAAQQQRQRGCDYYQFARGDVLDRQGRPLVNVEQCCLMLLPALLAEQEQQAITALARILDCPQSTVAAHMHAAGGTAYAPSLLKSGLSPQQAREVAELGLPGLFCCEMVARYDSSGLACHLLGYVQPVGQQGAYVGVSGLEQQYDELLRGRVDAQLSLAVDARGNIFGAARLQQPEQVYSSSLTLTLDRDYQQLAQQALAQAGYSGACVVMEPNSGDLLALASTPAFDPYGWQQATDGAYLNRCLQLYPPASTFKTVLAAAALSLDVRPAATSAAVDEAAVDEADVDDADVDEADDDDEADDGGARPAVFVCTGAYTLPTGRVVSCAGGQAHGELELAQALSCSCNCYFTALGQALGGERLREYQARLGLSQLSVDGLDVPDYAARDFLSFNNSLVGEVANVSLGENGVAVSAVQQAALFSCYVNGGFRVYPRLVTSSCDRWGREQQYQSQQPRRVLDTAVAETLRLMLVQVVEQGTGRAAAGQWVTAGGKTGSSESGPVWFCGFFPAQAPRLVVAVCVEGGSAGGAEAAAVFRQVADGVCLLEGRV